MDHWIALREDKEGRSLEGQSESIRKREHAELRGSGKGERQNGIVEIWKEGEGKEVRMRR